MRTAGISIIVLAATGCTFDEQLPQVDVQGTLILPREAATYTVVNPQNGEETEVTDPRAIPFGQTSLGILGAGAAGMNSGSNAGNNKGGDGDGAKDGSPRQQGKEKAGCCGGGCVVM